MYILARADIGPGLQAAQSAHAAFQISAEYPQVVEDWLKDSSTIVLLSVDSEDQLLEWADVCHKERVTYLLVREPDLGDEHTALIVPPSHVGPRFSELPLQGEVVVVV